MRLCQCNEALSIVFEREHIHAVHLQATLSGRKTPILWPTLQEPACYGMTPFDRYQASRCIVSGCWVDGDLETVTGMVEKPIRYRPSLYKTTGISLLIHGM